MGGKKGEMELRREEEREREERKKERGGKMGGVEREITDSGIH